MRRLHSAGGENCPTFRRAPSPSLFPPHPLLNPPSPICPPLLAPRRTLRLRCAYWLSLRSRCVSTRGTTRAGEGLPPRFSCCLARLRLRPGVFAALFGVCRFMPRASVRAVLRTGLRLCADFMRRLAPAHFSCRPRGAAQGGCAPLTPSRSPLRQRGLQFL